MEEKNKQSLADEVSKKEVLAFLSKHKLMSVGTHFREPWAASVYYLFDDSFNLYFVSDPKTTHCKNIAKNPKVSVTIVDSNQNPAGKKIGFQGNGIAKRLTSLKEIKEMIVVWNKRGFVPMTLKLITKVWKSRFYKIKLGKIQMFNESSDKEIRNWKI